MRSRSNGSPPARWRRRRTLDFWRGSSAAATRDSERIIEAAERRRLTAGKPDIHVADDEGTRHAAHSEPYRRVQVREGTAAEGGKHLAGIEERRQLETHARAEGVEARHARAQLRAAARARWSRCGRRRGWRAPRTEHCQRTACSAPPRARRA